MRTVGVPPCDWSQQSISINITPFPYIWATDQDVSVASRYDIFISWVVPCRRGLAAPVQARHDLF
jgi:hypothetical protein